MKSVESSNAVGACDMAVTNGERQISVAQKRVVMDFIEKCVQIFLNYDICVYPIGVDYGYAAVAVCFVIKDHSKYLNERNQIEGELKDAKPSLGAIRITDEQDFASDTTRLFAEIAVGEPQNLPSPLAFKGELPDGGLMLSLGTDLKRRPIEVDIENRSVITVAGDEYNVRSFIASTIVSLAGRYSPNLLRIVTFGREEQGYLDLFDALPHMLLMGKLLRPKSVAGLLYALSEEIKDRKARLIGANAKNIGEYNEKNEDKIAHLLCVITDFQLFTEEYLLHSVRINDFIRDMHDDARNTGVHFIFAYDFSTHAVMPFFRSEADLRVCFKSQRMLEDIYAIGKKIGCYLGPQHDMFFKVGASEEKRGCSYFLSDEQIRLFVSRLKGSSAARFDVNLGKKVDNGDIAALLPECDKQMTRNDLLERECLRVLLQRGPCGIAGLTSLLKAPLEEIRTALASLERKGLVERAVLKFVAKMTDVQFVDKYKCHL